MDVDERDHIFAVIETQNRNSLKFEIGLYSGVSECCTSKPTNLKFDLEVTS